MFRMKKSDGFTLTEMAIVLVIVALLIGGMLIPLGAQQEVRDVTATRKILEETNEILLGFAMSKGYLPCPAKSASDGTEDRNNSGQCNKRIGYLPWVTLSSPKADAWGRLLRYSVAMDFSRSDTPFSLTTARDITIRTRDASNTLGNLTDLNDVPAVVVSHGKNGYRGTQADSGTVLADCPGSVCSTNNDDEDSNGTGDRVFVSRTPVPDSTSATGGGFDDILVWLSPNTLFNRMISAGRLP